MAPHSPNQADLQAQIDDLKAELEVLEQKVKASKTRPAPIANIPANAYDLMNSGRTEASGYKNKIAFKAIIGSLIDLDGQWDKDGNLITDPSKLEWNPQETPFLKNLSLHYWWLDPGSKDEQHPHREDEIYYILKGTGSILMGRTEDEAKEFPLKPGDIIYVPRGMWHHFCKHEQEGLHILVFFGPDYSG